MNYRADYLLDPPAEPTFNGPADAEMGERWIYLHMGPERECIYVGMTRTPEARTLRHEQASEWFGQVEQLIWFGPMADLHAASVEREFITALDPANNVRHTTREFHNMQPHLQVAHCERRLARLRGEIASTEARLARARSRIEGSA